MYSLYVDIRWISHSANMVINGTLPGKKNHLCATISISKTTGSFLHCPLHKLCSILLFKLTGLSLGWRQDILYNLLHTKVTYVCTILSKSLFSFQCFGLLSKPLCCPVHEHKLRLGTTFLSQRFLDTGVGNSSTEDNCEK